VRSLGRIIERWKDLTRIRDDKYKPLFSKRALEHWHSIDNLYEAFKDSEGKYQPRTWGELNARVPKASLSRLLRELLSGKYVLADLTIDGNGKRETVYRVLKEWAPEVTMKVAVAKLKMSDGSRKDLGEYWGKIYVRQGKRLHSPPKTRIRCSDQEKALLKQRLREAEEVEKKSP